MVFQLAYGLETVVLRVFNVYGPLQGFGEYGGVQFWMKSWITPCLFLDSSILFRLARQHSSSFSLLVLSQPTPSVYYMIQI